LTLNSFAELGLSKRLLRALEDANYDTPTPIQTQAIPLLLDGADLLGIAQTGTGKTAAFTLPLLDNLAEDDEKPRAKQPRALILAPTRELVIQISESIKTYARHMPVRQTTVIGGVGAKPQINAMRHGVDILVATPGRLLDLINQRHLDLRSTEYLILDEADRMLDMGFIKDVRKIVAMMPGERQTLLFSATMPPEITRLANEILFEPERVEIAARTVAVELLVFTRTKHGANKVVKHLGHAGIDADAIHGNKSQSARQKALEKFRAGKLRVLVATDIASRGIDVDGVTHVINYELPNVPESYVHRIGRTARAGASGIAISFCDASERPHLKTIERLIKRPIDVVGSVPLEVETPANTNKKPAMPGRKRRRRPNRRAA